MAVAQQSVAKRRAVDLRKRTLRKPRHPYNVEQEAYQIQPHLIAQVLPGETLMNMRDQARIVTDPLLNKLIGWWCEKSYFYVKLSQMQHSDVWTSWLVDEDADLSAHHEAARVATYHKKAAAVDWVYQCLEDIVGYWYRDEGETWNTPAIGGIPLAQLSRANWANSLITETAYEAFDQTITHETGTPDTSEAREVEDALAKWHFMTEVERADWTYEDWLADQGVRVKRTPTGKMPPELLGRQVEWTFPTNTVDPNDGSVTSACVWSMSVNIERKFFDEPGFIVGVTVARPKMYWENQEGTMLDNLNHAFQWVPHIMNEHPETSLVAHASTTDPLASITGDAIVYDHKDLLMYGEQFVNHVIDENDNGIAIPEADADRLYPVEADLDSFFVTPIGSNLIRQDGVVSMRIKTFQQDTT